MPRGNWEILGNQPPPPKTQKQKGKTQLKNHSKTTSDNQKHGSTKIKNTLNTTMGKWGKWVSTKSGQEKIDIGKGERGKGKGENVGAGKVGKLNDHHTKQPYVALKTKWEKWGKCANRENGKNLKG